MSNIDPEKMKAAKDTKAAEAARAEAVEKERRANQLGQAENAIDRCEEVSESLAKMAERIAKLANHLDGLYEEVDKLAKGKALVEATDLAVEQANTVVHDAKELIENDPYLQKIKEFVPAGNNPVYPDVLLTLRGVKQAVDRFREALAGRRDSLTAKQVDAETIYMALLIFDKHDRMPTRHWVQQNVDCAVTNKWFKGSASDAEFNFAKLDRTDLEQYFDIDAGSE